MLPEGIARQYESVVPTVRIYGRPLLEYNEHELRLIVAMQLTLNTRQREQYASERSLMNELRKAGK